MASFCNYELNVFGDRDEVASLVGEFRKYSVPHHDRGTSVTFARWGWPVEDGPGAYSLTTEVTDAGRVTGTTAWGPPLEFIRQLTAHRPLLVECVSTTGSEEYERWVAWRGECHHLLTALVDPKDDTVQAVRVAGRAVGAKGVAA